MKLRFRAEFLIVGAGICAFLAMQPATQPVNSQQSITAVNKVAEGLKTTTFETPAGRIEVNLPEDMSAGDTLSGTVLAEPAGNTPEEIAKASDELSGYVVEVRKAEEAPPRVAETPTEAHVEKPHKQVHGTRKPPRVCPGHPFTCMLPAAPQPLEIALVKDTKTACKSGVDYPQTPPAGHHCPDGECEIPCAGQAGRAVAIKTASDGRSDNSSVCIGGKPCQILAESPRGMIAKAPKDIIGTTEIKVQKGNKVATAPFCCLAVKLKAGKTTLKKGETTSVEVTVTGLDGVKGSVRLRLINKTPKTVQMEGGNDREITISG
jgi:hypothetical protein